MANIATDVANQALDAMGHETVITDLEDGSREAQVLLRAYSQCLRQLLRGAHWDFARKQAPLQLLADATGQTAGAGSVVPIPWVYEYVYPNDCMKVRFIPWNLAANTPGVPSQNIQTQGTADNVPLMTNFGQSPISMTRIKPARFTIAMDPNYPTPPGTAFWEVQGEAPDGRTVILSNVQNAQAIYTAFVPYPSRWDSKFRAAMVAYLASETALAILKDKKMALVIQGRLIEAVKKKLNDARISDGNEGWFSSDITVDWLRFRNSGGFWRDSGWSGGDGIGPGQPWGAWDQVSFGDGSAF
jgi:hypothetical protein